MAYYTKIELEDMLQDMLSRALRDREWQREREYRPRGISLADTLLERSLPRALRDLERLPSLSGVSDRTARNVRR